MPPDEWLEPVNRCLKHLNSDIYVLLQGPSELGATRCRWSAYGLEPGIDPNYSEADTYIEAPASIEEYLPLLPPGLDGVRIPGRVDYILLRLCITAVIPG